MDIFGILDPDPHANLCVSETPITGISKWIPVRVNFLFHKWKYLTPPYFSAMQGCASGSCLVAGSGYVPCSTLPVPMWTKFNFIFESCRAYSIINYWWCLNVKMQLIVINVIYYCPVGTRAGRSRVWRRSRRSPVSRPWAGWRAGSRAALAGTRGREVGFSVSPSFSPPVLYCVDSYSEFISGFLTISGSKMGEGKWGGRRKKGKWK